MKSWVKLYTEISRDPKLLTLTWAQRGIWAVLLAMTGEIDDRDESDNETGRLDTVEYTAIRIRCDPEELEDALRCMAERQMIEIRDGVVFILHFRDRQARFREEKDRIRARVARHRHKMRSPILERDGHKCRYCGRALGLDECVIDHVMPIAQGGREDDDNLVTACTLCNSHKGARTPEQAGMILLPLTNKDESLRNDAKGYVTTPDPDPDPESDPDPDTDTDPTTAAAGPELPSDKSNGETTALYALIEKSGVIVASALQAQQWDGLLDITQDMGLVGEAFQDCAAQRKLPSPKYIRAILERCMADGTRPGVKPRDIGPGPPAKRRGHIAASAATIEAALAKSRARGSK
jgi:hypothetical protein